MMTPYEKLLGEVQATDLRGLLYAICTRDRAIWSQGQAAFPEDHPAALQLLAKALLCHADGRGGRVPCDRSRFAELMRLARDIVDQDGSEDAGDPDDVIASMLIRVHYALQIDRMWQHTHLLPRFFHLMNGDEAYPELQSDPQWLCLTETLERLYGFDHRHLFAVATALWVSSKSGSVVRSRLFSHTLRPEELAASLDILLGRMALPMARYREVYQTNSMYSCRDYPKTACSILRDYPIVADPDDRDCADVLHFPSIYLLLLRLTLGIYYDLLADAGKREQEANPRNPNPLYNNPLSQFWGKLLQRYVERQLCCSRKSRVIGEFKYGPRSGYDSPDCVVCDRGGLAFVQVKLSGPTQSLRTTGELSDLESWFLSGFALGHVQNIENLERLRCGVLCVEGYEAETPVHSVVVCPESMPWFDAPPIRKVFCRAVDRLLQSRHFAGKVHYECVALGLDDVEFLAPHIDILGGFFRVLSEYGRYRRSLRVRPYAGTPENPKDPHFTSWLHSLLQRRKRKMLGNPLLEAEMERLKTEGPRVLQFVQ